jgi:hypothetical protein
VVLIHCFSFGSRGRRRDEVLSKDEAKATSLSWLHGKKRDTARGCDDVGRRKGDTKEENG